MEKGGGEGVKEFLPLKRGKKGQERETGSGK